MYEELPVHNNLTFTGKPLHAFIATPVTRVVFLYRKQRVGCFLFFFFFFGAGGWLHRTRRTGDAPGGRRAAPGQREECVSAAQRSAMVGPEGAHTPPRCFLHRLLSIT